MSSTVLTLIVLGGLAVLSSAIVAIRKAGTLQLVAGPKLIVATV